MKQIISSLDVGSSTIKLVVGEIYKNKLLVLSCNEVESEGIKKGVVVNPEKTIIKIKELFSQAEDILGIKINKVLLNVPSYYAEFIKSDGYTTITREEKIVTGEDITRALQASVYNKVKNNYELVSVMPVEFILNDNIVTKNPKGMEAFKISVNSLIGLIPKKNIYNLLSILENLNIEVIDLCFASQADYYEFKDKEKQNSLGAVINIGSEKTEVALISEGILVSVELLDIGGNNIDKDISYIYDIPIRESKKIKEEYALCYKTNSGTSEIVDCLTNDNTHIKINQYEVSEIVYSRVREILELTKKQINLLTKKDLSYIIITGGSTEIEGFSKVFKEVFGKQKEISKVEELGVRNNKYSSTLGLIKYYYEKLSFRDKQARTITDEQEEEMFTQKKKIDNTSLLGKVYSYFFDN